MILHQVSAPNVEDTTSSTLLLVIAFPSQFLHVPSQSLFLIDSLILDGIYLHSGDQSALTGDAAERFGGRDSEKFKFLGK